MNGVIGLGWLGYGLWQRGFVYAASTSMGIGAYLAMGRQFLELIMHLFVISLISYGLWHHMPLARGVCLVGGGLAIGLGVLMGVLMALAFGKSGHVPAELGRPAALFFVYGLVQIGVLTRPSVRVLFDKTTSVVRRSGGD
jgi:hypothetical protein